MSESPVHYRPPDQHQDHIRKMAIGLAVFFTTLTVLAVLFVLNAHHIAKHLPFSAEKRFTTPYESMARRWADDPGPQQQVIEAYLQSLVNRLSEEMDVPDEFMITVHFMDDGTPNAFATLGGHIFVFRGLIEELPDENSLAMVLAHEVAHIKHRDPIVSLGRGLALQLIYGFVTGDYAAGSDLAAYGAEVGLLYFSREQEQAADLAAISTLQDHYGHVAGYDDFFVAMERMAEESEEVQGSIPEWLSTHPDLHNRIEDLRRLVAANHWPESTPESIPQAVLQALSPAEE